MPLEIEVKMKVEGHEAVRQRLEQLGARRAGMVRETNVFFDRDGGELRQRDTGLRVRFSRPIEPAGLAPQAMESPPATLLTVKGPAATHGLRSREAYDLHVEPGDQLVPLLRMLGFEQVLLFEKDRESWEFEGCLVELDRLPVFGDFVEIEGPSEEAVRRVQARLGLDRFESEHASYSKMAGEHATRAGTRELRF